MSEIRLTISIVKSHYLWCYRLVHVSQREASGFNASGSVYPKYSLFNDAFGTQYISFIALRLVQGKMT
jgi:hypothetical protein